MKSKKIIASVAAMSVLAMSTMSFAAINFNNSKVTNIDLGAKTTVTAKGETNIDKITAKTLEAMESTIDATGVTGEGNSVPDKDSIINGTDEKQKCETLLYKQVA